MRSYTALQSTPHDISIAKGLPEQRLDTPDTSTKVPAPPARAKSIPAEASEADAMAPLLSSGASSSLMKPATALMFG